MIAVIFGGHGFIGCHLARELATSGKYSRVVSADIASSPRFRTAGVDYVYCDVTKCIPTDLAPDVSEIYNLAAVHVTPGHQDWEYYWTNVSGAICVTDYARRANARTLFFTSSISVYGPSEAKKSEEAPLLPESHYGRSKVLAEQIHQTWQTEQPSNRRLIIVRPAVIFGYGERGNFTRLAALLARHLFIYPGRKDTIKACGYVKDLVKSLMFAAEKTDRITIYNFAYQDSFTTEKICAAFCELTDAAKPSLVFPLRIMLFIGSLFEHLNRLGIKTSINQARIEKLYKSTNISPKWLEQTHFVPQFDLKSALNDWRAHSSTGKFE
ncbi:NAD(P)-dependent oxidoreductase [uncultured Bradyrhizobium sp.]|jgi:nucleoside-diphosphate-sugar epimerase|uniref:NAD-dependent epimerase/dehydratase family protein n=1 Tax=uncultured Bradyrhizobium sp. TaxID=199684 RepID=UPI0026017C9B|nr:NAD(P)-dependent oxidoreductase [uncultured Bradyrhizobium sp.]